ncbi:MAG: hypothetical protein QE263_07710 [Vampirovibrionales bacterium]|nr:hypothetical protein [Vampirovibrionales bacterium]
MSESPTLYFSLNNTAPPPPKKFFRNPLKAVSTEPVRVPLTAEETQKAQQLLEEAGLIVDVEKPLVKDIVIIGGKIKGIETIEKPALIAEKERIVALLAEKFGSTFNIFGAAGNRAKQMLMMVHSL